MPERLTEIYQALDNDPFLVMECFVRPVLVERLGRNFFDYDDRIHREAEARAGELRMRLIRGELDPRQEHPLRGVVNEAPASEHPFVGPARDLRLLSAPVLEEDEPGREPAFRTPSPAVGPVVEEREAFVIDVPLTEDPLHGRLARYRLPKRTWQEWWSEAEVRFDERKASAVAPVAGMLLLPSGTSGGLDESCLQDDTWDNGSLAEKPIAIDGPAVWTGTHMLVGTRADFIRKYDPLTDTWSASSARTLIGGGHYPTAVWTGHVMIVWGGGAAGTNTGARYDPIADTWQPTTTVGAPSARWSHTAVWTGSRMIIWGGSGNNTGGLYDPVTDTWTPTNPLSTPTGRSWHTAVWTGSRMIVWGGGRTGAAARDGGIYDPESDRWVDLYTLDALSYRFGHSAVWTGSKMIVWGGSSGGVVQNTGASYDPSSNSWSPMSSVNAPQARTEHAALWTGNLMLVWGGRTIDEGPVGTGGRYNLDTDMWEGVSNVNAPQPRQDFGAVWTGEKMIVFGGVWDNGFDKFRLATGGRYDPITDTWTPTSSTANGPTFRIGHRAVWTGNEMIVWGGSDAAFDAFASGARYDPLTDSWRQTSLTGAPEGRGGHAQVWTGDEMLVWGGDHRIFNSSRPLNTGGRYDPVSDTWCNITEVGVPQARALPSGVWTGNRMIVWGGAIPGGTTNSGGSYDPASDTWAPISTTGAPEGRYFHAAVWTSDRMIVWGGDTGTATAGYDTGGVYDPATDNWRPTSLAGAPSARFGHAWTWTGEELVVFSGAACLYCPPFRSGGRYDPVHDSWTPTSELNAPAGSLGYRGIWTGREMIVYGPQGGGRYDPASDTWKPVSLIDAPSVAGITMVWTGTHMIVWGVDGSGGRYVAFYPRDDDEDGFTTCGGDCDDAEPSSYPGAEELCDGKDNDCDGVVPPEEADADGDGFRGCQNDCNDSDPAINPLAVELPGNAVDENCDGVLACDPGAFYKNHGQFVRCVAQECGHLVAAGAVSQAQCETLISQAARSDTGRRPRQRPRGQPSEP
jgi:N-acetylneuraminic acid mutarotase